jgi:hypothetical protein
MATNYIYTNSLRLQGTVLYKGDFLVSRGVVRIVFHHKGDLGLLLNSSKIVDHSLSSYRLQARKVIVLCPQLCRDRCHLSSNATYIYEHNKRY